MVPWEGLEPSIPYGNAILSRARIPFRHHGMGLFYRNYLPRKNVLPLCCTLHGTLRILQLRLLRLLPRRRSHRTQIQPDDSIRFIETIKLPESEKPSYRAPTSIIFFCSTSLGGISYYKAYIPKNIEVRSGSLTSDEAAFWTQVYETASGNFFFRNKIDYRGW